MNHAAAIPLALYIHLPWCVRKCPYCDFNSHKAPDSLPEAGYVDALIHDLDFDLPLAGGRPLESIFFGGGTPSLFSPTAIGRILDAVRARLPLVEHCEITLEANPGAVEQERFTGFRAAGVNRLSIGVQSLDDAMLRRLGRIHDADSARAAIAAARAAGFDNLNLDMMYGLPEQSVAAAAADLDSLLELAPEHVSYYQLTLEPGTAFHHRPPPIPDHDTAWKMHHQAQAQMKRAGFEAYEVSAWSRPHHDCRHNRIYWTFGDYLGIGAGAHGKLTDARRGQVHRRAKQPMPNRYRAAAGTADAVVGRRTLTATDIRFEFLMNALRLQQGFDRATFESHTGQDWSTLVASLAPAADRGLLQLDDERAVCTNLGAYHLDTLLIDLLPDPEAI